VFWGLTVLFVLAACASPQVDTSDKAEASFDGLVPLKGTQVEKVWVRPDLDLSSYTKLMPGGAAIQYRPVDDVPSNFRATSSETEFPLSEDAKARLREIITEELEKALQRVTRYEIVDAPGPETIKVRGAFLDVVSRVPPEPMGRSEIYLSSVGQATFVIEILDSQTEQVLIRAADTRAMESTGTTFRSNAVTNASEARRLFARWASLVVDALNNVTSIEDLSG
jgi:hypothetical protein